MVQVPVTDVYVYTPPPQPARAMTTIAHHNRERAKALLFHTGVSKRNLMGGARPADTGDELNASVHEGSSAPPADTGDELNVSVHEGSSAI